MSFDLIFFLNLFALIPCFNGETIDLDYLRLLDDRLMYSIDYKPIDQFPADIEEKEGKLVQITSPDQEQYKCLIPTINTYSKKRIEAYTGPSPAQLLNPIYDESICSYKFEAYWNYELCHGRYVLQYHEEKDTKKRTEFFLGNYVSVAAVVEAKNFDQLNPPTKKIGDEVRAYYPVTYSHGTLCDLNGKPRQTVVLYVCEENAQQNIYSFTEISSCHYEIIVFANELCAHPAFQIMPRKENEIKCFPLSKLHNEDPKPKAVIKIQEEAEKQYAQEYALLKQLTDVKTAKQIFSKFFQINDESIEDGFGQLTAVLESIKKVAQQKRADMKKSLASKEHSQEKQELTKDPESPPNELEQIVKGFFRGTVCLHGGFGWWKYEVCYGKTVMQYHSEIGKKRENILLGVFDKAVHMAWAIEHPEKVIERNEDGKVMSATNLYTQGDKCEENGAHRSCEVRIRCRDDIVSQKVFIYMLEPSTCQYIVVLESTMFCEPLQNVDSFGLLRENMGALITLAPTEIDEKQSKKENKDDLN
uniref:Endoplasmic reticulum lectin 1 n=1 Tax=Meloidogyne enterolobii TaxID=390850 RepID=A0A6V7WSN6_MELEN|nr:unnamed protein product [Meloidogyne enterolobii]